MVSMQQWSAKIWTSLKDKISTHYIYENFKNKKNRIGLKLQNILTLGKKFLL